MSDETRKKNGFRSSVIRLGFLSLPFFLAALFLLWETRGQTLYADEWFFFFHSVGGRPGWLLYPDQGNLVFGAVLVYKATLAIAGAESHLPLRLVWVGLDLLCASLFLALMRRRVGTFAAWVPAVVLSVFGASWEMFGGSLGINVLTSVAAGLAALLALEGGTRRGDVLGCLFLTFSVLSHSTGLAIAAGIVALLLISTGGWRRIWVAVPALVLYAVWALWARQFGQSEITLQTLSSAPASIVSLLESAASSMFGTFRGSGAEIGGPSYLVISVDREPGILLAVILVAVIAARIGRRRFEPRFMPPLLMIFTYWLSLGLVSPARNPSSGRYQYASVIFVLLLFGELWRGWRPSRNAKVAIALIGIIAIVPNMVNLHYAAEFMRGVSERDRASLGVLDALRDHVGPKTVGESSPTVDIEHDMAFVAGDYFKAVDSFGSPGEPVNDLPTASAAAREEADRELVHLLGIEPRLALHNPLGQSGDCKVVMAPTGTFSGVGYRVSGGAFSLQSMDGSDVTVGVRRYSNVFDTFAPLSGGQVFILHIPVDGIAAPWYGAFESSGPVRICGLVI